MTSAINPTNIDGAYPVAGQDNNSQGFRDNFTNIKVNFQEAAAEITDLQSKVVLKAALTGTALDNNMNDVLLYAAKIQDFSASKVTVANTSGPIAINYASGHYQSISTTGSITLSFTNFPANGSYGYIKLQINITNTAHTVTLPVSVTLGTSGLQGYSAGVITFGATGTYEFAFGTYDGGTTVTIFDLNRALTNFATANLTIGTISATTANVTGNITGGNISSAGILSTTGNVTGGNLITAGLITSTGNITGGNIATSGRITATGNVAASNLQGFVRPAAGSASQAPITFTSGTNTSVAGAGTFEYDGVVFYSSPTASSRGVAASEYLITLTTNYTANDSTSPQKVFNSPTNGAITLDANTTYLFEGTYYIAPSINMNAVSVGTLFALGGTLTSIRYTADSSTGLAAAVTASKRTQVGAVTNTTVTDAAPGGAATNFVITVKGVVRTNTAGTFTPQIQFSGATGSAPVIQANSYFKLTPVGTGSVASVGNWS
jgi:hypothetical protein